VANFFQKLGVKVFDADAIAQQITQDRIIIDKIVKNFGENILTEEHQLDRKKLRQKIFNEPTKKKWLDELLHPLIQAEIKNQLHSLEAPYCIVVIPLLVETNFNDFISRVLVVDAPEELQIKRASIRDRCQPEEIKKIMAAQATRASRCARADDIIHNDGDKENIAQQVEKLHQFYSTVVRAN
jgi:dephospho-CoA kinase